MAFFGALIAPDLTLRETVEQVTIGQIRDVMARLIPLIHEFTGPGMTQVLRFGGTNREQFPGPPGARVGTSTVFASVAGLGFWQADAPMKSSRLTPQAANNAALMARATYAEQAAQELLVQREALQRSAEAAIPLRVRVLPDVQGSMEYSFEEACLRRMAYLLAFEASLEAASLSPYTDHLLILRSGSQNDLAAQCPAPDAAGAFSIYLNLASFLEGLLIEQGEEAVRDHVEKRQWLADNLEAASDILSQHLHADGQRALQALRDEFDYVRQSQLYLSAMPPLWGQYASTGRPLA